MNKEYFMTRNTYCIRLLINTPTLVCILFSVFISSLVSASKAHSTEQKISLHDVLVSTLKHHPQVKQALTIEQQAQASQLQSQGAFDWQVEQESFARTSGFYNGWLLDQEISRALPVANAKVAGGYRISDGSFPIYEDVNRTLSGGEAYVELELSLLRNRNIDKNRAAVIDADIDLDLAGEKQKLILNKLLLEASLQFIDWMRAQQSLEIVEQLVLLAKNRQNAISQKVAAGELARITLTEFTVTLLRREAELISMQQALENQRIGLSMFLRTSDSTPLILPATTQASTALEASLKTLPPKPDLINALNRHPQIAEFELEIAKLKAKLNLNKDAVRPQLDLKVKLSNDIGSGSQTLEGFNSYVGLDFSVPIGQREAKGRIENNRAELARVSSQQREARERINMRLDQALAALRNFSQLSALRESQAELAQQLMNEEQLRFDSGDSDLFLLNARETDMARARLAALEANISLLKQHFVILASSATLHERVRLQ